MHSTQIVASIKNNPKLREAAEQMKRSGLRISDGVTEALQAVEESEFMRQLAKTSAAISQGVSTATAPVRNTQAYKALSESVVEAFEESSRYGGYEEKEVRRKKREERLRKAGLSGKRKRMALNPEAGEALVLSAEQEPENTWKDRLRSTDTYQRWNEAYQEREPCGFHLEERDFDRRRMVRGERDGQGHQVDQTSGPGFPDGVFPKGVEGVYRTGSSRRVHQCGQGEFEDVVRRGSESTYMRPCSRCKELIAGQ
jgi:hypothetical protein